mmetsp:Transcript_1420/g.4599  ORF Transcript_1420/g.4599 Transcript_1420/m.4599 type:complete len:211 (-) Transcript_1420:264-896(-)
MASSARERSPRATVLARTSPSTPVGHLHLRVEVRRRPWEPAQSRRRRHEDLKAAAACHAAGASCCLNGRLSASPPGPSPRRSRRCPRPPRERPSGPGGPAGCARCTEPLWAPLFLAAPPNCPCPAQVSRARCRPCPPGAGLRRRPSSPAQAEISRRDQQTERQLQGTAPRTEGGQLAAVSPPFFRGTPLLLVLQVAPRPDGTSCWRSKYP